MEYTSSSQELYTPNSTISYSRKEGCGGGCSLCTGKCRGRG